ncbi:MAG: TolC family protein, partial [Fibrobacter sp.]|nr:TolC family protein [Bacteroidaceae bacterium]MCF0223040.1 TolC family protein [Fibrobacter sp.]
MNRFLLLLSLPLLATLSVGAQELRLSLDSCINMALRENKQLQMERLRSEVSTDTRKAVRTKYMPRITGVAGYLYNSEELSLLSNDQKDALSNLGTTVGGVLQAKGQQVLPQVMGTLAQVFPEFQARIQALTP